MTLSFREEIYYKRAGRCNATTCGFYGINGEIWAKLERCGAKEGQMNEKVILHTSDFCLECF